MSNIRHIFIIGGLLLCAVMLSAAVPEVRIPRVKNDLTKEILAKGEFLAPQWKDAAVLRAFKPERQELGPLPVTTAVFLQHDGENLLVAALCQEKNPADAQAFLRGPEDDLTLDECIQISLGLDGKTIGQMTMGGYENAFGELGKCAHFYEMCVNMAGAATRRYNETPLPNPRFQKFLKQEKGLWTVIFVIPFESAAINFNYHRKIHFNAVRFYRGGRYGWHPASFGGYTPVSFGIAHLLDFKDNAARTQQGQHAIKAVKPALPALNKGILNIEYYAASAEIGSEVPAGNEGADIQLLVNGKVLKEEKGSGFWPTRLSASVSDYGIGKEITAELKSNGKVLLQKKFTTRGGRTWRTGVAKEYLDTRVPYPWKTPVFQDGKVQLAFGTVDFGKGMLPERITTGRNTEVLAAPITLEAARGQEKLSVNLRGSVKTSPVAVEMTSAALPGLEVKTRIEYDGFTVIRARITGGKGSPIDSLKLRIPLADKVAQWVNPGSSQKLYQTGGFGYRGNAYSSAFWIGSQNAGIIIDSDRQLFYSPRNGRQIEITGDEVVMNFVTPDGIIPPEGTVFEFFLQGTPSRTDTISLMNADFWFESWSDYQSYPDQTKNEEMQRRIKAAKDNGKDFFIYFGQTLAENTPEFQQFTTDIMAEPRRPWYKRAYNPGKDVPCSVICFRGEAGEMILDGTEKLAVNNGLPGVYLDGPSSPFACDNLNHRCSAYLPAIWDEPWNKGQVSGQREYLKRLRGIFDSRGSRHPLWHHTGGGYHLVTFALCDYYWDGEQLARYRKGYLLEPNRFSIIYSGTPFGWQGIFLPIFYTDATLTTKQSLAWTLPHGVVNAISGKSYFEKYFEITTRNPEARFYPYTAQQPHIRKVAEDSLITSYYLADKEAVILSGNIVYHGTQQAQLDISGLFPGKKVRIRCMNRNEVPDFKDGILSYEVAVRDVRVYHVCPVEEAAALDPLMPDIVRKPAVVPPAVPLQTQNTFDSARWQLTGGKLDPVKESGLPYALRSVNVPARLSYKDSLPDNVRLKLKFRHNGPFRFIVDGVKLSLDYTRNKGWLVEGVSEYDSEERSDVTLKAHGHSYNAANKLIEVEIFIVNGRISMWYDGVRILQHGLPAAEYTAGHTLALETKQNGWCAFDLEYLGPGTDDDMPVMLHPVY